MAYNYGYDPTKSAGDNMDAIVGGNAYQAFAKAIGGNSSDPWTQTYNSLSAQLNGTGKAYDEAYVNNWADSVRKAARLSTMPASSGVSTQPAQSTVPPPYGSSSGGTMPGALPTAANGYDIGYGADAYLNPSSMQGATSWSPTSDALVSNQLERLLNKDSSFLQLARTRAMQSAASRGLLNSSIAAGAGETAAIDTARPIAEGDANAYFQAQRDNAMAANQFSRDSNQFGRDSAMTRYKGVLDAVAQGRDLDLRREDLNFRRDSTGRDLDLRQQQLNSDSAYRNADLNYRQGASEKDFALRGQDMQQRAEQVSQQMRSQLAGDISRIRQQAIDAQMRLEADPNMTSDAKANAIASISAKASADIAELVRFTGIDLPQAWPDWINIDNGSGNTAKPISTPYVAADQPRDAFIPTPAGGIGGA